MNLQAKIAGIGGFAPSTIRTNEHLASVSDTSVEWILRRTGIRERRILQDGLATSDMVVEAIKDMLLKTTLAFDEIDCLIIATTTPDMPMPSTATIVCRKLGIKNSFAFDVNAACSGFLYALTLGTSLIESGKYKNVIVAGADKMSSVTDIYDRNTNILFGDAAGVVLLQQAVDNECDEKYIRTISEGNGEGIEFLNIEGGGSLYPSSMETLMSGRHYLKQDGKVVFKKAIEKMTSVSERLLQENNLSIDEIDWFVSHQANYRIIEAVGTNLKINSSKVLSNVAMYGNTTAASIPLCLWSFQDKIKKGDLVLLTAFGAGFTWGSALIKWDI